jgi:pilus assembly protein CpaF
MEEDVVSMQDIFTFEKEGVSQSGKVLGAFRATGIRPKFVDKLIASGIAVPATVFDECVRISA